MSNDTEMHFSHRQTTGKGRDGETWRFFNPRARCLTSCVRTRIRPPLCVFFFFFLSFHLELRFFFSDSPSIALLEQRWRPNADSRRLLVSDNFPSILGAPLLDFVFSLLHLHRSGKDPPRVALHKRVVDEESIELALRQHYPADYRYPGRPVISSRVRPTVWWRPLARRNEN